MHLTSRSSVPLDGRKSSVRPYGALRIIWKDGGMGGEKKVISQFLLGRQAQQVQ